MKKEQRKIELHLHLDCSISYRVASSLIPGISPGVFRRKLVAPEKCKDLPDYLKRADAAIEILQDIDALRLTTSDLIRQLNEENIAYAEIRFAPLEHTTKGLKPEEVVEAVLEELKKQTKRFPIDCGLIICTLRHYDEKKSLQAAALATRYQNEGVVGFDLAADESYPADAHIRAFEWVRKQGMKTTAHAGEARGAESVWEVLNKLKPDRIGHGVRCVEDPELLAYLCKKNIHLEVCPSSNIQTNVYQQLEQHSLPKLFKEGISFSINTDSRTISYTTLTREYQLVKDVFGMNDQIVEYARSEAIKNAFMRPDKRRFL